MGIGKRAQSGKTSTMTDADGPCKDAPSGSEDVLGSLLWDPGIFWKQKMAEDERGFVLIGV